MTALDRSSRARALRRYPALAFLALAAVLAVLLPSALTVPNSGPPTLAEFAPVPGHGPQGSGDLGRLGSGSSGGLGTNGGSGGPGQPVDPGQPPSSLKRCVGRPLRQTEDPLSPPCVAFWEGDNGGATARGVTKDEVRIVIHWGSSTEPRVEDYRPAPSSDDDINAQTAKAYQRYFNDRYQTFGRIVHFFGYYGHGTTPAQIRADVQQIADEVKPFAVIPRFTVASSLFSEVAAREGIVVASYAGLARSIYRDVAPAMFSYAPDVEDTAAIGASFLCRKLAGRVARFSGNPIDLNRKRTFGILYTDNASDPVHGDLARAMRAATKRTCGVDPEMAPITQQGRDAYDDFALAIDRFQSDQITTVIPITQSGTILVYLGAASAQSYRPEWFFLRDAAGDSPDNPVAARTNPSDEWQHAFGFSFDERRGRLDEQPWYMAFRETCPDCTISGGYTTSALYESLTLFFYGLQSAGPKLTLPSLDKGLHAIPRRPSASPYTPAAYFEPGNYSWVKDAKAMWWDAAGRIPGSSQPGCYRLGRGGLRYRAGEWPAGDDDLFQNDQPCQYPPANTG